MAFIIRHRQLSFGIFNFDVSVQNFNQNTRNVDHILLIKMQDYNGENES